MILYILFCFLSDTLVISDSNGVYMFESIPVSVKMSIREGIRVELDLSKIMFYEGDTVKVFWRQKVFLLRQEKDFNDNIWGEVEWTFRKAVCDTLPILDTVRLRGFIILKNGKTNKWYVEPELKERGIRFRFGFLYGQSFGEIKGELATDRNFSPVILLIIGIWLGELVLVLYLGKMFRLGKFWSCILLILLWVMTGVAFGIMHMSDLQFILKGGLK